MPETNLRWLAMPSVVEYHRHKDQLFKELFRRIGYTNTLYKIFRFGEVVKNTHQLFPASQATLVRSIRQHHPELDDVKYATGVVDVLGALDVLRRAGPRIILTEHGRALAALTQQPWYESCKKIFFLRAVLEADGDYLLNLLKLLPEASVGSEGTKSLGVVFFNSILALLNQRREEVTDVVSAAWIQRPAVQQLSRAEDSIRYDILNEPRPPRTLTLEERLKQLRARRRGRTKRATTGPTETLRHTLDPRRGWLVDFGLVTVTERRAYQLTPCGSRLLEKVKSDGFEVNGLLRTPFSKPLAQTLGIQSDVQIPRDYFHRLAVDIYHQGEANEYQNSLESFLADLRHFFPLVKLDKFNQAEIPALYECVSIKAALDGKLLTEKRFHACLEKALGQFGEQVYRVSGRHGQEGYLAFRRQRS